MYYAQQYADLYHKYEGNFENFQGDDYYIYYDILSYLSYYKDESGLYFTSDEDFVKLFGIELNVPKPFGKIDLHDADVIDISRDNGLYYDILVQSTESNLSSFQQTVFVGRDNSQEWIYRATDENG